MKRRGAVLLAVSALAAALALPSLASAGTYGVRICGVGPEGGDGAGITLSNDGGTTGFFIVNECGTANGGFITLSGLGQTVLTGGIHWTLTAPPGVTIVSVAADRTIGLDPNVGWEVRTGANKLLESLIQSNPQEQPANYTVGDRKMTATLRCGLPCIPAPGDNTFFSFAQLANVVATFNDEVTPQITMTPPGDVTPLRGIVHFPYVDHDSGAGIAVTQLRGDFERTAKTGTLLNEQRDTNGGECAVPFTALTPCKLDIAAEFSLDTNELPDGIHTLTGIATDASGNEGETQHFTILVHNAPTELARPNLSGTAAVGQTLSTDDGSWEGDPALTQQWLRCPANIADGSTTGCTEILGATAARYLAAPADLGRRLEARVTATNAAGTVTVVSPASAAVAPEIVTGPGTGTGSGGPEQEKGNGNGSGPGNGNGSGNTPGPGTGASPGSASSPGDAGLRPQTEITKHPTKKTATASAKFRFTSDQLSSHFECKLDKGAFKPCRSPFRRKVKPGHHKFQVRAVDPGGFADLSPALFKWTVRPAGR